MTKEKWNSWKKANYGCCDLRPFYIIYFLKLHQYIIFNYYLISQLWRAAATFAPSLYICTPVKQIVTLLLPTTTTTMSLLLPTNLQQCPPSTAFSVIAPHRRCLRLVTSCVSYDQSSFANGSAPNVVVVERDQIRLGLVSKGRMATNSLDLLKVSG